jgi:hypothetical protein
METKSYALFYDFDKYVKFTENKLDFEVGETTIVTSKTGKHKNVMVYATFNLTEKQYLAAKMEMHNIFGITYNVLNAFCEKIQCEMTTLVANYEEREEEKERIAEFICDNLEAIFNYFNY